MITVGDFLAKLITKGGGNPADDKFKIFFGNADLVKAEVPDDVATAIDNGLISLKDAKNNHPDIKNHYTALALNGLDDKVNLTMDEWELPEDSKNKIRVDRNSYNRVSLLLKEVKELEQRKANADKPDKIAIQKQIDEAKAESRRYQAEVETAKLDAANQIKDFKLTAARQKLYGGYKTVFDTLEPEAKEAAIDAIITKKLQDTGSHFTFDENGSFVLLKKDGMNFYGDDNKQVNAKQFIEQQLSQNKILAVTAPPTNGSNTQSPPPGQQPNMPPQGSNGNGNNNSGSALLKEMLQTSTKDLVESGNVPAFGMGGN